MLYNELKGKIERNRDRIIGGVSNTIKWDMPRLEQYLPGIEREKLYCITANTSVGKSKLAKYMFVTSPFDHWLENPKEKVNVLYYSLEESKHYFLTNILSYYLFKVYGIKKSSKEIMSLKSPVDDETIKKVEKLTPLMEQFLSVVKVIDDVRKPLDIYLHILKNLVKDEDAYNIIVVDHLSLLGTDRISPTTREAMIKFTSDYALTLRDKHKCSICVVQQQAADQEDLDHFKEKKLEPSLNGLGDAKICGRDYNVVLGLFAPARHELAAYRGYDISRLNDNYRALWIVKDREGEANIVDHLYFDGKVNYFKELPKPAELNYSLV